MPAQSEQQGIPINEQPQTRLYYWNIIIRVSVFEEEYANQVTLQITSMLSCS